MRVPIAGGAPEFVLEASRGATVRCTLGHPPCVLSELDKVNGELVFSTFDPLRGKTMQMVRLAFATATGSFTVIQNGVTFTINNAGSAGVFAEMGTERNGSFLP